MLSGRGWLIVFGLVPICLLAWLIPWVPVLALGGLVYSPYLPDQKSRYFRLAGPLLNAESWVSDIPDNCQKAAIAAEDALFLKHRGVDYKSLQRSMEKYWHPSPERKGRKVKKTGGSTITQQLVKNAFLSRDQTVLRKGREIAGALLLDVLISKEDQLRWYFNIIEFGPKVYGIKEAAEHYFNKKPEQLSKLECAGLVAILPSPNKWGAHLQRPTAFLKARRQTILARINGAIIEDLPEPPDFEGAEDTVPENSSNIPEPPQVEDVVPTAESSDEFKQDGALH